MSSRFLSQVDDGSSSFDQSLNTFDNVTFSGIKTSKVTIANQYTLPVTKATSPNEVLLDPLGDGNLVWGSTAGLGDVTGDVSATANAIARFSGVSGKSIKNSSIIIGDAGDLQLPESVTPANPPVTNHKLYFKNDGNLYKINSGGVESQVGGITDFGNLLTVAENNDGSLNAGFMAQTENGAVFPNNWAGLVQDRAKNTWSLFNTSATKPSSTQAIPVNGILELKESQHNGSVIVGKTESASGVVWNTPDRHIKETATGLEMVASGEIELFGSSITVNASAGQVIDLNADEVVSAGILKLGTGASDLTYPNARGTTGQVLSVDGLGVLGFTTPQNIVNPVSYNGGAQTQDTIITYDAGKNLQSSALSVIGTTLSSGTGLTLSGTSIIGKVIGNNQLEITPTINRLRVGATETLYQDATDTAIKNNLVAENGLTIGATPAVDYIMPSTRGADTQVLRTDALGNVSWSDDVQTGTKTTNALTTWDASGVLQSTALGVVSEEITNVSAGAKLKLSGVNAQISTAGSKRLDVGPTYVQIGADGTSNFQLPYSRGTAGQVLADTLGDGVLEWSNPIAGAVSASGNVVGGQIAIWSDASGDLISSGGLSLTNGSNLVKSGVGQINFGTVEMEYDTSLLTTRHAFQITTINKMSVGRDDVELNVPLYAENGTEEFPSISYASDTSSGTYRAAQHDLRTSINTVDAIQISNGSGVIAAPAASSMDALAAEYGTPSCCIGTRKLLTAYAGNCCQISTIEGLTEVGFDAYGQANIADTAGLTEPFNISILYDQSGNGRNWEGVALSGFKPKLVFSTINGIVVPRIENPAGGKLRTITATVADLGLNNLEHSFVITASSKTATTNYYVLHSSETSTHLVRMNNLSGLFYTDDSGSNVDLGSPFGTFTDAKFHVISAGPSDIGGGTYVLNLRGDGDLASSGTNVQIPYTDRVQLFMAANTTGNTFIGYLTEAAWFPTTWVYDSAAYTNFLNESYFWSTHGYVNTSVRLTASDELQVDGDFRYQKGHVEFWDENDVAPFTDNAMTLNVAKKMVFKNIVVDFSMGFTVATPTDGTITYNGNRRRTGHCGTTISVECDTNATLIEMYWAVSTDGGIVYNPIASSKVDQYYSNNSFGQPVSTAIHCFIDAVPGNKYQLWAECSKTCNLRLRHTNQFITLLPNVIP